MRNETIYLPYILFIAIFLLTDRTSSFTPASYSSRTKNAAFAKLTQRQIQSPLTFSLSFDRQYCHGILPLFLSAGDSNEEPAIDIISREESSKKPPEPVIKCPNCDKCDGSGRILGGIPTILPWWPIKPYRPCPNFIANGGQYSRIGQPLDEIAFGRASVDVEDDDF